MHMLLRPGTSVSLAGPESWTILAQDESGGNRGWCELKSICIDSLCWQIFSSPQGIHLFKSLFRYTFDILSCGMYRYSVWSQAARKEAPLRHWGTPWHCAPGHLQAHCSQWMLRDLLFWRSNVGRVLSKLFASFEFYGSWVWAYGALVHHRRSHYEPLPRHFSSLATSFWASTLHNLWDESMVDQATALAQNIQVGAAWDLERHISDAWPI